MLRDVENSKPEIVLAVIFWEFPTNACLESLSATAHLPIEVLVLTKEKRQANNPAILPLRVIETTSSFASAMNTGLAHATGEFVCFLDGNAIVMTGWLEKLLTAMQSDGKRAVAGNLHLDPETQQIEHAGFALDTRGRPVPLYRGQPRDFWPALVDQEFQMVSPACWLVRRDIFLAQGGFDTRLGRGWEALDFCLRARAQGYRISYVAESVILLRSDAEQGIYDAQTSEVFLAKWGKVLVDDTESFYPRPELPLLSATAPESFLPFPSAMATPSHIERRYAHVEHLQHRHPLIASILRTVIRGATSLAKSINGRSR